MHMWESKHAYRKWPEQMWMHTWAVIHKALSRSEVSAQLRHNFEHVIEQNKINHAWQLNQTNNQSIINSLMLGPHQSPIYIAWINLTNSIVPKLWKWHSCLYKIKRKKNYLKNKVELKLFEWKLDFWNLFKSWSPEDYLIIGALGIEFKNENFGNKIWKSKILKNCLTAEF